MSNLEQVMDRWMNDTSFREAMRRDPEGAVQDAGMALSPEDKAALQDIDWKQPDSSFSSVSARGIEVHKFTPPTAWLEPPSYGGARAHSFSRRSR